MLRLDIDQYDEAVERMAVALQRAEDAQMRTMAGRAMVMLEALGGDFDVAPMDPGPRDDIESGNVWPRCEHCPEDHDTTDHDTVLMERILAETVAHNRSLGASAGGGVKSTKDRSWSANRGSDRMFR